MNSAHIRLNSGADFALLAAALFGASTPISKVLLGRISPIMLAGLLYLGSGMALLSGRVSVVASTPSDRERRV